MKRLNKQGFSMIELLVVLLIIGILAAVAAPFFLQNADKSRCSEAVAAAGSVRSAERSYFASNNAYIAVAAGGSYFDTGGANAATLGVTMHGTRYFSGEAYTVAIPGAWPAGTGSGTPQDFLITVNGANSVTSVADGAPSATQVANDRVIMDNNGLVYFSTNSGTSWSAY